MTDSTAYSNYIPQYIQGAFYCQFACITENLSFNCYINTNM